MDHHEIISSDYKLFYNQTMCLHISKLIIDRL